MKLENNKSFKSERSVLYGRKEIHLPSNSVVDVGFFSSAETTIDLAKEALVEQLEENHSRPRIHHLCQHPKH